MAIRAENSSPNRNTAAGLRTELARKIASYVGSSEKRVTEIPGLSLHRRTSPTAPCSALYESSVIVIAQGRKRVDLGGTPFIYDPTRYLLTSVDLPVVTRVVDATEQAPCLAMLLKLQLPLVRELLNREEIQITAAPSEGPAMATGETTPEFLGACCRRWRLCVHQRPALSGGDRLSDLGFRGAELARC